MAFSSRQKLEYLQGMFKQRIDEIETLDEMIMLINNISPTAVKNFISNQLEWVQQNKLLDASRATTAASDIEALQTELTSI